MDISAIKPASATGLMVSQIGYDARLMKRAVIRSTGRAFAVGNLQWICGLNAGITAESLRGQIVGVGRRSVGGFLSVVAVLRNHMSVPWNQSNL
jgi:hypothetical protein